MAFEPGWVAEEGVQALEGAPGPLSAGAQGYSLVVHSGEDGGGQVNQSYPHTATSYTSWGSGTNYILSLTQQSRPSLMSHTVHDIQLVGIIITYGSHFYGAIVLKCFFIDYVYPQSDNKIETLI